MSVCFHYRSQLQFKLKVVDLSDQWPKLNAHCSVIQTPFTITFLGLEMRPVTSGPSLTQLPFDSLNHRAAQTTFPFSTWDSAKADQEFVDDADPCDTTDNGPFITSLYGLCPLTTVGRKDTWKPVISRRQGQRQNQSFNSDY